MAKRNIVVIGASAGGVPVLIALVKSLPQDFQASIFIVLHVAPHSPSLLPGILSRSGPLEAVHPNDGEPIEAGRIYVAPPDHHMLIEEDHVVVRRGPKENGFRPSVDALFRSAAYVFGPRVVGVVLTGSLDDGTSGLWSVKRLGGITIVQDPAEALFPSMPVNVLEYVEAHYILPVADIGPVLTQLTDEPAAARPEISQEELKRLGMEVLIASQDDAFEIGIIDVGDFTSFTCPQCHGALKQLREGKLVRFRCHTGHAFTMNALLAEVSASAEDTLWSAMRSLQENILLLNQLSKHFQELGQSDAAILFAQKAEETAARVKKMRTVTLKQENISEDIRLVK